MGNILFVRIVVAEFLLRAADRSVRYLMDEINKQFEPSVKLALALSKIVHDRCKNVPHDIGLILAEEVICHLTSKSTRPDNAERFHCAMCGGPIKHVKHGQLILISGGRKDDIGEL